MEKWRDVEGFEGIYMVSTYGRVKRLAKYGVLRSNQHGSYLQDYEEIHMSANNDSHGYPQVALRWCGEHRVARVHRLVAETFLPNPQGLPQVHHIDHSTDNPRLDNLMWVDQNTNQLLSYEQTERKAPKGEESPRSKYKEDTVREVYLLASRGEMSQKDIGVMFDMPQITVSNIKTKKTWREITDLLDIKCCIAS